MLVMTVSAVPPKLRGLLSRWMLEIQTGVYVGQVNSTVRDLIWERALQINPDSQMTQAWNSNTDQGYLFRVHGDPSRRLVNLDGFLLAGKVTAKSMQKRQKHR